MQKMRKAFLYSEKCIYLYINYKKKIAFKTLIREEEMSKFKKKFSLLIHYEGVLRNSSNFTYTLRKNLNKKLPLKIPRILLC